MKPEARLGKVLIACEKAFGTRRNKSELPALETAILAVLAPGNSDDAAASAIEDLRKEFVDWNEVRVSSWKEIGYTLEAHKIVCPGQKAFILKKLLEAVFSRMNKMSLDSLSQVKPEEARRTLEQMTDLPDDAAGAVWTVSLGQDSIYTSPGLLRVAHRIGFIQDGNPQKIRKFVEDKVQKKDRFQLQQHLGYISSATCMATSTLCSACPLSMDACETGMARIEREEELVRAAAARDAEAARKEAAKLKKAAEKEQASISRKNKTHAASSKPLQKKTSPPAKKAEVKTAK